MCLKEGIVINDIPIINPVRKDANAYIEIEFNGKEDMVKELLPQQQIIVSVRIWDEKNTKLVVDNDYSYLGNGEEIEREYVEWQYIPIYDKTSGENLIFGKEPSVLEGGLEPSLKVEFNPYTVVGENYMNLAIRL